MNLLKIALLFLAVSSVISLQLVHRVAFHDAPLDLNALRSAQLAKHNFYRALHGSPALAINNTLNNAAQSYANVISAGGSLIHSEAAKKGLYGQNLYWAWGYPTYTYSNAAASASWYSEIRYYDYKTFTTNVAGKAVGHFTAMVWKGTRSVGFGYAQVQENKGYAVYVVANYYPTPNVQGLYGSNVTPPV